MLQAAPVFSTRLPMSSSTVRKLRANFVMDASTAASVTSFTRAVSSSLFMLRPISYLADTPLESAEGVITLSIKSGSGSTGWLGGDTWCSSDDEAVWEIPAGARCCAGFGVGLSPVGAMRSANMSSAMLTTKPAGNYTTD